MTYSPQGFIQNITLPSTATSPYLFDNFTQPAGMDFMAVMWDDEGYPGTGVTDVLSMYGCTGSPNASARLMFVGCSGWIFRRYVVSSSVSLTHISPLPFLTFPQLPRPGSILPDFFFYTSTDNPGQCSNVDITWQANYTPPAHIVGMIPGGDIWNIHSIAGAGETSYTWRVDVREGTRVVLTMPDAGPIGTGGR